MVTVYESVNGLGTLQTQDDTVTYNDSITSLKTLKDSAWQLDFYHNMPWLDVSSF